MKITHLDHVVLTARDIPATVKFYTEVLGMAHVVFDGHFDALHFGAQKINIHPYRAEYRPHADIPMPGTADFCFVAEGGITTVVERLVQCGCPIELGPVEQTGARGPMCSVYVRDPDRNLIEIACYPANP